MDVEEVNIPLDWQTCERHVNEKTLFHEQRSQVAAVTFPLSSSMLQKRLKNVRSAPMTIQATE